MRRIGELSAALERTDEDTRFSGLINGEKPTKSAVLEAAGITVPTARAKIGGTLYLVWPLAEVAS